MMNPEIFAYFPAPPEYRIDWLRLEQYAPLRAWVRDLRRTPQERAWHGEGDVWTHTRMVCEELASMAAFRRLDERRRREVFLAALLHDVGKARTTRQEDGRWTAPYHARTGARMAGTWLMRDMKCGGTKEDQIFRGTVCALISCHMLPLRLWEQEDGRRLYQIAANAALVPDFSMELLCLLAEADIRGRIAPDTAESVEKVELTRELAQEKGCYECPKAFASRYAQRAFFQGRLSWEGADLYDDTWGEVLLLSGLPGTGKDTWIREQYPDLPMVSLDEIRREKDISPGDPQGPAAAEATERARVLLRAQEPFVWNATNLKPSIRQKQISLFESYNAAVRIVFLETSWEEGLRRNAGRTYAVPEAVIGGMLEEMIPPQRFEAQEVEWLCV